MKNLTLLFTSLLLVATSLPARGQGKADGAAKAKPADPFIKDQKGKVDQPAGAKGAPTGNQITNVGLVMQHIDVKRERWQKWLSENATPLEAGLLRREVEAWITAGDAKLAETSLIMGRSGNRSKVESIRQVWNPTKFNSHQSGLPVPIEFQSKNLGTTLEMDPVLGLDGRCDYNFSPERIAYSGEKPPRQESGAEASDIRWPSFRSQRVTSQVILGGEEWGLIGCEASLDGAKSYQTLIFTRSLLHYFEDKSEKSDLSHGMGMLTLQWLEVGHDQFNGWLMNAGDVSEWIGGALHAKALAAGATIFDEKVMRFQSGQRLKNESVEEVIYPTEYSFDDEGKIFATPTATEIRNTGVTLEVDTVLGASGESLDLSMIPEQVFHFGHSVHHRLLVDTQWKPNLTKPVFYVMKTQTQVILPLDSSVLVSVLSPPDENGNINSARKVLLFVKVSR